LTTDDHENEIDRPSGNQTGLDPNLRDEIQRSTPGQMTPDEAREITKQIRSTVENMWELIIQAYRKRAWAALDYPSWDEYCRKEFNKIPQRRITHEERAEIIAGMRGSGMTIRAIASAVPTGKRQVEEALAGLSSERTPERVTSTDGKSHPARKRRTTKVDRLRAERKRMKEQVAKAKAEEAQPVPPTLPAIVVGIISDLNAANICIDHQLHDDDGGWKITPAQRREIAHAITCCAQALGMRFDGITFDDGGFSLSTPEPEGP
jgi:hypothetical protein